MNNRATAVSTLATNDEQLENEPLTILLIRYNGQSLRYSPLINNNAYLTTFVC